MDQPPAPPSPATLSQGHNLYHCLGEKQTNQDLEEAKHCSHARLELRGSPSVVPRPAVPVSPESLLDMHTQVPPRPGSETLGVGPASVLTRPSGDSDAGWCVRTLLSKRKKSSKLAFC